MTNTPLSLHIDDLSAFTKALRKSLTEAGAVPGHLSLLGHVSRAAGYRNYQHLRAELPEMEYDRALVQRAQRVFDADGRMQRWPSGTKLQGLCLWVFWVRMPPHRAMSEPEVNALLKAGSCFGDHVLLRRSLIDHKLADRDIDGRAYRRIEQRPSPEALALIRALKPGAIEPDGNA